MEKQRDTFMPGGVHIREYSTPYRTRAIISGPLPQVMAAVQTYYRQWPPEGYGTMQVDHYAGFNRAEYTLSRLNSCD